MQKQEQEIQRRNRKYKGMGNKGKKQEVQRKEQLGNKGQQQLGNKGKNQFGNEGKKLEYKGRKEMQKKEQEKKGRNRR